MADPAQFSERMAEVFDAVFTNRANKGFACDILRQHVRLGPSSPGPPARVTFYTTVAPEMCNGLGNLHGGCASTLIDVTTSTLLCAVGGHFGLGGVSRALSVNFLRPAPEGVEIAVHCELVQAGKRLALMRAEIRRVDDGQLLVLGGHDKASTPLDLEAKI